MANTGLAATEFGSSLSIRGQPRGIDHGAEGDLEEIREVKSWIDEAHTRVQELEPEAVEA